MISILFIIFVCFFFYFVCIDEMLESEKSSLAGRVHDLERRVLTQQDEIVCLRSTLADVLRRLNMFEGNLDRSVNGGNSTTGPINLHGGRSAPSTPSRIGSAGLNRSEYNHLNITKKN